MTAADHEAAIRKVLDGVYLEPEESLHRLRASEALDALVGMLQQTAEMQHRAEQGWADTAELLQQAEREVPALREHVAALKTDLEVAHAMDMTATAKQWEGSFNAQKLLAESFREEADSRLHENEELEVRAERAEQERDKAKKAIEDRMKFDWMQADAGQDAESQEVRAKAAEARVRLLEEELREIAQMNGYGQKCHGDCSQVARAVLAATTAPPEPRLGPPDANWWERP